VQTEEKAMKNENLNYFKVVCKCGHVGRQHYVPIQFAVIAESKKEAARIAREFPRVKHQHKDAILNIYQISYEDYLELKEINNNDPYLHCHSKKEQNLTCDLTGRIVDDLHNAKVTFNKEVRKARVAYIQKKQKIAEKYFWEVDYEYCY